MINSLIDFIENNKKIERGNIDKKYLKKKEVYCSFCKITKIIKLDKTQIVQIPVTFIY